MNHTTRMLIAAVLLLLGVTACSQPAPEPPAAGASVVGAPDTDAEDVATEDTDAENTAEEAASAESDVQYTLRTVVGGEVPMAFVGEGGDIDGVVNPTLEAAVGDVVELTVINGDPIQHDLVIDEFNATTGEMNEKDEEVTITFTVTEPGEFDYYCSIPGHKEAGMVGTLLVTGEAADYAGETTQTTTQTDNAEAQAEPEPAVEDAVSVVHHPTDIPESVGSRGAETIRVDLEAVEVDGQLDDGTTYRYMTFDGQVPGPMIRARVDDTIEIHVTNNMDSALPHSIDLHAVTGPGGGAVFTQTQAGEESVFTFKALKPGLFVYHCATPSVAHHITSGMYGMILIEPEGGLPPVDHEFYVMQGELYTEQPYGTEGNLTFSYEKMLDEDAEYLVFNGAAGALTQDEYALEAEVGDTVRIFFGVGGPNYTSSFHVIGEMFDRVYSQASLTSEPLTDVQTTVVPPGGATMVEFTVEVPGTYILVDHALSRLERGLVGYLNVTGDENPDIFHEGSAGEDAGS